MSCAHVPFSTFMGATMSDDALKFIGMIVTLAVVWAGYALHGHLMYGDWRCGFIQCRVVVEVE